MNIRLLRTYLNFDVLNMFHSINEMPKLSYFPFVFGNNKNHGKPPFDNEVLNIFTRIRHELLHRVDQFLTVVCLTFHCQMGAFSIFVVSKHKWKVAEFKQMLWNMLGTSKFRSVLNNQIFTHLLDCMPILTTSFIVSFDKMQERTSSGNSLIWSLLN